MSKNVPNDDIIWFLNNNACLTGRIERNAVLVPGIPSEMQQEFTTKLQLLMFEYEVTRLEVSWNGTELIKMLGGMAPTF